MEKLQADLVIIGSGAAGLCAALVAQEKIPRTLLITKGRLFHGGSTFDNINGQWGLTRAQNVREQEILFRSIQEAACGTNDPLLSQILVEESQACFRRLQDWGVRFITEPAGNTLQRFTPCFCKTQLAVILQSIDQFRKVMHKRLDLSRITVLEQTRATELLVRNATLGGLLVQHRDTTIQVDTRTAILATGGNAALFRRHIAAADCIGDGYTLLQKAGIPLRNMEYLQRVWEDVDRNAPRFSLSAFFDGLHSFQTSTGKPIDLPPPDSELARSRQEHVPIGNLSRDRAFDALLLDHTDKLDKDQSIRVWRDSEKQAVHHILPHVQTCNGGVLIGPHGETPINGLYAAGEVATGMHGGDRVGGTMITASQVFATRAAQAALGYVS